ncbi:MAG: holo-[acyl-carrier protein] synthase [Fusobacteriaceae bacterium]|jgi:holo-[acyl-carrier protein] synthase|nr:holo-acyl-carrier-protein synthase [Fusobacteriales bacterium]MDN5304894.1 holo-[acyl-carrier protein] synthase [Fusobacteriaceae bacterium]
MEIIGIGNDIVEIERIKKAIERNENFKRRVYTENEINYAEKSNIRKYEIYAGRFAAKEVLSKAFGTGIRGFKLTDIEILNDAIGKPYVVLKNSLKDKYLNFELLRTISHNKTMAFATAILIKK